ncbi:MAG: serine/threonine protein kinase [Myxococcales bacterium]|nr:serine/threonine protein kinase [Myxococcales bacterium]
MSAVDDASLKPGLLVTANIRLDKPLGRGAMGSVWLADHLVLQTQVVVKFLSGDYLDDSVLMARFEREAALAARAKGPHVVQVFDHGTTAGGIPFIAMEHLEGEDLGKRIKRDGRIDAQVFARWLSQLAKGLGKAHKNGVVHRDIKPENIFLCDNEGEILVKILDFGVAKGETSSAFSGTATNAMIGTPYYMSPEQMMGSKDIDHRADLWAVAVVAFKALTGQLPFEAQVIGQLVHAIGSKAHPLPSSLVPDLPAGVGEGIDAWMAKALAKLPEHRFSSAKELSDAFSLAVGVPLPPIIDEQSSLGRGSKADLGGSGPAPRGLSGSTISATTNESSGPTLSRKSRYLAAGAATGALVAGALVVVLLLPGPRGSRDTPTADARVAPIAPATADLHPSATTVVDANPGERPAAPRVADVVAPVAAVADAGETAVPSPSPGPSASSGGKEGGKEGGRRRPPPAAIEPRRPPRTTNPLDMPIQ